MAVHSLDASRRFKVANFAVHALKYIEQFLTTESVLLVFVKLIRFSTICQCKKGVKMCYDIKSSSSTQEELDKECIEEQNKSNAKQEMFDRLINKCLQMIDENAEKIMMSEEFETLPLKLVHFIVKRDSIYVSSELQVLYALDRWSRVQCYMQNLSPSPTNKQRMLCGGQYLVRWLTMTVDEIKQSHRQCGLLREKEVLSILRVISHPKCRCALTRRMQEFRMKISLPRVRYIPEREAEDPKESLKVFKNWDCEAQQYRESCSTERHMEDKMYEHIGDCVDEVPDDIHEIENIYQTIEDPDSKQALHYGTLQKHQDKRCTCAKLKRSKTFQSKDKFLKNQTFYQGDGRHLRQIIGSNGTTAPREDQLFSEEFNTLEKIIFCLSCMFD